MSGGDTNSSKVKTKRIADTVDSLELERLKFVAN